MSDRPPPFGSDTLVVPAFFSRRPDDPALAQWKLEHPDWFEAGTWTAARRRPRSKQGVMSRLTRPASPAWMRETRDIEREQRARARPRSEAEWLQQALASATVPLPDVASQPMVAKVADVANTPPSPEIDSLVLVDDQGQVVITRTGPRAGQPMHFPASLDPHFFVARGLQANPLPPEPTLLPIDSEPGSASAFLQVLDLLKFRQGREWDAQRLGGRLHDEWVDYATVAIGLYAAAAGLTRSEILTLEDQYAAQNSKFSDIAGRRPEMDDDYAHLPRRNVANTELGFDLYQSGRISLVKPDQ